MGTSATTDSEVSQPTNVTANTTGVTLGAASLRSLWVRRRRSGAAVCSTQPVTQDTGLARTAAGQAVTALPRAYRKITVRLQAAMAEA